MQNKFIKILSFLTVLFLYNSGAQAVSAMVSVGATGTNCVDFSDESTCNTIECVLDRTSGMGGQNCSGYELICYRSETSGGPTISTNYYVKSCTSCPTGYTLSITPKSVKSKYASACTVKFKTCTKATGETVCPSSCPNTYWTNTTMNRQVRCVTTSKVPSCEYRCQKNYYKTSTLNPPTCTACPSYATCNYGDILCNRGTWRTNTINGFYTRVTCTPCPSLDGVQGTTAPNTQTVYITACYIPANTPITNSIGTYIFKENCNYSN